MGADWRETCVILVYKWQRQGQSFSSMSTLDSRPLSLLSPLPCSACPQPLHFSHSSCTLIHSSLLSVSQTATLPSHLTLLLNYLIRQSLCNFSFFLFWQNNSKQKISWEIKSQWSIFGSKTTEAWWTREAFYSAVLCYCKLLTLH